MNAEQPRPRYSGVTWHAKKWLAKFRYRGRDLSLGHYEDPELAAWVADFARYLCFGLNPVTWHHRVGRPNFPPCVRNDFPRVAILSQLTRQGILSPHILSERLAEYDAVVQENANRRFALICSLPAILLRFVAVASRWRAAACFTCRANHLMRRLTHVEPWRSSV